LQDAIKPRIMTAIEVSPRHMSTLSGLVPDGLQSC
jgi:hypothetical protein